MDKELKQVVKKIQNEYLEELNMYTDFIKPLAEDKHATMYEKDFRKFILPIIKGDVKADDTNMSILIHNVLQITNSPYVPIDVIDNNTEEVLFTFPPLLANHEDNKIVSELFNYNKLIHDYKSLSNSHPGEAENILKRTLPNLAKLIEPDNEEVAKMKKEIIKMYEYYNLPNPFEAIENEIKNIQNNVQEETEEDLFDYD